MKVLKIRKYLNGPSINLQNSFSNRLLESSRINRIDRAISTIDPKDVEHLSKFKNEWWDLNGPLKLLHSFTPIRVQFVRDSLANAGFKIQNPALPLEGVKIADIGCGGGILTERLARIGAHVTGVDASTELIDIAKEHIKLDPTILDRVNYIQTTIEEFSPKNENLYDAVVASEVVEHVENPELFLKECVKILKPNGSIFITTINRTLASWLGAIVIAEYMFNLIPRNTHQWNKFIPPHEIQHTLDNYGCKTKLIHGIKVNPLTDHWTWSSFKSIHYALHAVKQRETKI